MSLLRNLSQWRHRLVVCLLVLGTGVHLASVTAAEPSRPSRKKVDPQKFKELNRLKAEREKLTREGKLDEAVAAIEKELTLFRELFGKDHKTVPRILQSLAQLQERRGDWAAARSALQEALAVQQHLYSKGDWRVTDARLALADVELRSRLTAEQRGQLRQASKLNQQLNPLFRGGKYREALSVAQQTLAITEQVLGEEHPKYVLDLNNLAFLYGRTGEYSKAEPLFRQSLALNKKLLGEHHPTYAISLNNLALLYKDMGAYDKAEPLFQKALTVRAKTLGKKHHDYTTSLNNLALLYYVMGDYAKAEPLYRQSLTLFKELKGEENPEYATSLNNLATLYTSMGAFAKAEPLHRQALALRKKLLDEKHPDYITSLNNLSALYYAKGEFAKAEPLKKKVLTLNKEVLGEKHPAYAIGLYNLAALYKDMGAYDKAEPLSEQALALNKNILGEKHPDYAKSLTNLAMLYLANEKARKGEPLIRQAAEIMRSQLEQTAAVQSERQQLVMLANSRKYLDCYLSMAAAVHTPAEEVYAAVLAWKGAVSARQQYLHLQRQSDQRPDVRNLYTELQQATARLAQLSNASPDPKRPGQLQRDLERVSDDIERLQRDLARLNEPFRQQLRQQRMTTAELRKALPQGAALVDLLEYDHTQRLANGKGKMVRGRRMTAFVLRPGRPIVQVDLGGAELIRHAVIQWRKHYGLGKPGMAAGRQLRQLVWERLEQHLGGVSTVLISPDGVLAKLPWAALPGRKPNTYLLEERAIAILPIPQQLPQLLQRPPAPADEKASLLLVGDVDYGADPGRAAVAVAARSAPRGQRAGLPHTWPPLSETGQEILAVRDSFEQRYTGGKVKVLRKGEATEEAVRQLAPQHRYLHFATHGFFVPPPPPSPPAGGRGQVHTPLPFPPSGGRRQVPTPLPSPPRAGRPQVNKPLPFPPAGGRRQVQKPLPSPPFGGRGQGEGGARRAVAARDAAKDAVSPSEPRNVAGFHPDLLSGLVMAGANRTAAEGDDGFLTALEVGALDLSGAELAVLSACETGLGAETGGEGLLGLQRAFQVAGTRSVVAGLWTVDDRATRALMVDFYDNLWGKKLSRLEALRQAQLHMLRSGVQRGMKRGLDLESDQPPDQPGRLPPFYWAAFVLSGDWR